MPTPCPSCTKFAALNPSDDLEVEDLEINEDGLITGQVRFVLTSDCCGDEMKEYTFDIEHDTSGVFDGKDRFKPDHKPEDDKELEVEAEASVDEVKIKGKKAYRLSIEFTITGEHLKGPVSDACTY